MSNNSEWFPRSVEQVIRDARTADTWIDLYRRNLVLALMDDKNEVFEPTNVCSPAYAFRPFRIFFTVIPQPDEGEYYNSTDLMDRYELGPAEFVGYLMLHRDLYPHGVPDWFYTQYIDGMDIPHRPSLNRQVEALDSLKFHYRTIRNHEKAMEDTGCYEKFFDEWQSNVPQSVPQSAEAQDRAKELEAVHRWNKRLNEQNQELRADLAAAQEKISELEAQAATANTTKGKRDTSAATIAKLRKDLESWKGALPLGVTATSAVIAAGKQLRTRKELRAICAACKVSFSGVQFESWRAVLPEGYFDKDDRSADPQNNVESVEGAE